MRSIVFALLVGASILTVACSEMNPPGAPVPTQRPTRLPLPPPVPDTPKVPTTTGTVPGPVSVPNTPSTADQPDIRGPHQSISTEVRRNQPFPETRKTTAPDSEANGDLADARFKSWSLFLMPNYDAPYKKPEMVRQLKKSFENLGSAIGPDNVSLWLVTGRAKEEEHPELTYDYERAQAIIRQLDLDSATGPYIVITLTSPNHLSPGVQAFVARLTGIRIECYPQIMDSLTEYIGKRHYDSARKFYNSVEEIKIAALRFTCTDASIDIFKVGK